MTEPTSNRLLKFARRFLISLLVVVGLIVLGFGLIGIASVWGREKIVSGEIERSYRVYVPSSYSGEKSVPLVLVFHMLTASGRNAEWLTHFNHIAEQEGFLVVYPDGYKASWAEGSGLYAADQAHIDDVLFISNLIDKLSVEYPIDRDKIYATGFSNGGFMVQRLGCDLADELTAIATVGATIPRNLIPSCNPPRALPVLMINGTADRGVLWKGDQDYASVAATVDLWVTQNGCDPKPYNFRAPNLSDDGTRLRRSEYSGCKENSRVILYTVIDGGHTWPGGNRAVQLWGLNGRISQEIDASQVIWSFFKALSE